MNYDDVITPIMVYKIPVGTEIRAHNVISGNWVALLTKKEVLLNPDAPGTFRSPTSYEVVTQLSTPKKLSERLVIDVWSISDYILEHCEYQPLIFTVNISMLYWPSPVNI